MKADDAVEAILGGKSSGRRCSRDPATKGRKAVGNAGKCSYPTSFPVDWGWAKPARSSPMGASPAVLRVFPSGHVRRKRASGGTIALIEDGDTIAIDIPKPQHSVAVEARLKSPHAARRRSRGDKSPDAENRQRQVSFALRLAASRATSADKGAVRDKSKTGRLMMAESQPLSVAPEGAEASARGATRASIRGGVRMPRKNGKLVTSG